MSKEILPDIGLRINKARIFRDLTIEAIAEKVNISPKTIYKYESGVTNPSVSSLVNLCNTLQFSSDYILIDYMNKDLYKPNTLDNEIYPNSYKVLSDKEKRLVNDFIEMLIDHR